MKGGDLASQTRYEEYKRNYHVRAMKKIELGQKGIEQKGIVVVDLCGGISSITFVLKHLGIKIAKVVSQYKYINASRPLSPSHYSSLLQYYIDIQSGLLKYVQWLHGEGIIEGVKAPGSKGAFVSDVTETKLLEKSWQTIIEKHTEDGGRGIDLISAGPPCQCFSRMNGTRGEFKGAEAEVFMSLPDIFRDIEDIQVKGMNLDPPFIFVEEVNPVKSIAEKMEKKIRLPGFVHNAGEIGPIARERFYMTNIFQKDEERYCADVPGSYVLGPGK